MNDALWYTRLAVWAGALVLLVQAIAGKGPSVLTLLATLCLALGFAAFLFALSFGPSVSPEGSDPDEPAGPVAAGPETGPPSGNTPSI